MIRALIHVSAALPLVLGLTAWAGCGAGAAPKPLAGPVRNRLTPDAGIPIVSDLPGADEGPDAVERIPDEATWRSIAARPDNAVFARTEVIKVIIDLADSRHLYLTNARRFPIHYYFARDRLSSPERPVEDHAAFNVREYRREDRRFVLGSIVRYLDPDIWTFEMIAGDDLAGPRVLEAFEQVRAAVYFGDRLRYRPLSDLHERLVAPVANRLPMVTTTDVLGAVRYQSVTPGVAYGHVRIVRGALDQGAIRRDEILVVDGVPPDLPPCAALVTGTLQAPLAHVAVLSQTRGTPNMALRGATTNERLLAWEGRLVRFEVAAQDFAINAATPAEAEAHFARLRPSRPFTPAANTSEQRLLSVCDLRSANADTAGAKAAQLGEVCALGQGIRTPGGFVVPFYHFVEGCRRHNLLQGIEGMLADDGFRTDRSVRARRLDELRRIIETVSVDPALVRAVRTRIRSFPRGRIIFRSSTNSEDLVGFSGAGLYRSVVVQPNPTEAAVADALRQVWGSVWTLRGYEEREWYRIDHRRVAMAVLIQPFVEGAVANGVAVTRNPFNEHRPAVFINVQAAGGSVTDAGEDVPEQHLVYTYTESPEPEVLSRSSLTGGRPILDEAEVIRLTEVLQRIHARLVPQYGEGADAVDVEFLLDRSRNVVIVQARPYSR